MNRSDAPDDQKPYADFGRWLTGTREKAGLSRKELARISGVPYPTLANLESGRRRLSNDVAEKLAPPLGVTAEFIILGRDGADAAHRPEDFERIGSLYQLKKDQPAAGLAVSDWQGWLHQFFDSLSTHAASSWIDPDVETTNEVGPRVSLLRSISALLQQLPADDLQRVQGYVAGLLDARRPAEATPDDLTRRATHETSGSASS